MKAHLYSILMLASLFFGLAACDKPASDFRLSGDCQVISLALDEDFEGIVDPKAKAIVVAIPEVYDERAMTITDLTLSDGATADKHVGDRLNLSTPQAIRVKNGDVMMEYTLSVKHDEARILSFIINGQYVGVIDQSAHTISVLVPVGSNLHSLTPTVTTTDGATLLPASGVVQDFSQPVLYTVSYNTASLTYLVTVAEMTSPHVLYVGLADTRQQLPIEEQTACSWLLSHVEKAAYASFTQLKDGQVDLSECQVIWWADCVPNNCWGQAEESAETVSGPWEFSIAGHTEHALWQNLIMKPDALDHVYTCDAGYRITNSTAQYHIGTDWGGYDDRDAFRSKTGAIDIAGGADAVVAWEYPATDAHGGIICIGSGCYDWYSVAGDAGTEYYHANIAKITENALNYLKK